MTRINLELKFPCGYEIKESVSTWFGDISLDDLPDECPIHGKKCVKVSGGDDE